MRDSGTSPQGFFATLKSLFIGNKPLNVEIEMHFFEASHDYFKIPPHYRPSHTLYNRTPFPRETTRFIWCEIDGHSFEWQPTRMYTLSYSIYRPDGTLFYNTTEHNLEIRLEDCDISRFTWKTYGCGWREPGYWPIGTYQAEVLIDGVRSATGSFTIAPPPPPPPPKPPEEVLQLPRVQFYALGREAIRFPYQTTREVSCKLTVRNLLYQQQYRSYPMMVQCSTVEERLLWESKPTWEISSQEQEPSISWSIQTSGWSQGIYSVVILIDGKEFAWGAFTIE